MFAVCVVGRLVQTQQTQVDTNKFLFEISDPTSLNHLMVFMTGVAPLEPGFGATIHFGFPNNTGEVQWKFLGSLSNEKPSALYQVKDHKETMADTGMDVVTSNARVGISIEPLEVVKQQQDALSFQTGHVSSRLTTVTAVAIAQKILEHFYNYVSSFFDAGETAKVVNTWYGIMQSKLAKDPDYYHPTKHS
eukprot:Lithocolla_globosa_v1_NODE_9503_length_699_cov_112.864907.p1 type:complete len:191 gc:universal NODE_9503_length_699_cov_112.864907:623-51(-)